MSGKGSGRRPAAVSASEVDKRWAQTFGGGSEAATGLGTAEAAKPIDYGNLVWVNVSPTEGA